MQRKKKSSQGASGIAVAPGADEEVPPLVVLVSIEDKRSQHMLGKRGEVVLKSTQDRLLQAWAEESKETSIQIRLPSKAGFSNVIVPSCSLVEASRLLTAGPLLNYSRKSRAFKRDVLRQAWCLDPRHFEPIEEIGTNLPNEDQFNVWYAHIHWAVQGQPLDYSQAGFVPTCVSRLYFDGQEQKEQDGDVTTMLSRMEQMLKRFMDWKALIFFPIWGPGDIDHYTLMVLQKSREAIGR